MKDEKSTTIRYTVTCENCGKKYYVPSDEGSYPCPECGDYNSVY